MNSWFFLVGLPFAEYNKRVTKIYVFFSLLCCFISYVWINKREDIALLKERILVFDLGSREWNKTKCLSFFSGQDFFRHLIYCINANWSSTQLHQPWYSWREYPDTGIKVSFCFVELLEYNCFGFLCLFRMIFLRSLERLMHGLLSDSI